MLHKKYLVVFFYPHFFTSSVNQLFNTITAPAFTIVLLTNKHAAFNQITKKKTQNDILIPIGCSQLILFYFHPNAI